MLQEYKFDFMHCFEAAHLSAQQMDSLFESLEEYGLIPVTAVQPTAAVETDGLSTISAAFDNALSRGSSMQSMLLACRLSWFCYQVLQTDCFVKVLKKAGACRGDLHQGESEF